MTPEDIERMAREAGIDAVRAVDYRREQGRGLTLPESQAWDSVTRFAALVRAQALEQAARVCEYTERKRAVHCDEPEDNEYAALYEAAEAVRALKEQK